MVYARSWLKCLAKIQLYTSVPTDQRNYYQLLGYLLSKITQKFEPVDISELADDYRTVSATNPTRHPMVEAMRYIYRSFDKSPVKTKAFLDWCLDKHGQNLNTAGLRSLVPIYRIELTKKPLSIPRRHDPLPDHWKQLLQCSTYGDLSFLSQIPEKLPELISKLQSINLTIEELHLNEVY